MANEMRFPDFLRFMAVWFIGAVCLIGCSPTVDRPVISQAEISEPSEQPKTPELPASPLRWHFTEGKIYRWSVEVSNELEAPQGDQIAHVTQSVRIDFDVEAIIVSAEKSVLEITVARVRAEGDLPDVKIHYDSASETAADENDLMTSMMALTYQTVLDLKMTAIVNPRGVVERLDVDPEIKDVFQNSRALKATAVLLEPKGLNSIFFGGLIPMPDKPLSIGDDWTEELTSPSGLAFASFQIKFTPRYVGTESVDGQVIGKFALITEAVFSESLASLVRFGEQKSSGQMYFDRQAGLLSRCDWSVDSELIFNDGMAKGRMILGTSSTFALKEGNATQTQPQTNDER